MTSSSSKPSSGLLSRRTWFVLAALAITGQIAWAVENSWFNTFVYDVLTPDPRPVAWMVAASGIMATLTTLLMGTFSDRTRSRMGRRKPYILFGYILWGLSTIVFPMTAYIKVTAVAVWMVVIADSVMTFFGSTANDAAFSAWTADIATSSTRGRVEGVLQVSVFIAQILVTVAAGVLIDSVGYFIFFYALGAIVILVGLIGGGLLQDAPAPALPDPLPSVWKEFGELFRWQTVRENRDLFLLLTYVLISSTGLQVCFPYLIIYLENFIGITKTEFSIIGGAVMLGSGAVAIPFGLLADRWDRKKMLILATLASAVGGLALSFARSLPMLTLAAFIWQGFWVGAGVASGAWMKDLLPEENRGKFLGVRMIFWIALPMLIGPFIGSQLIQTFGEPTVQNGQAGFIPHPVIFQVGAALTVLSLLPFLIAARRRQPIQKG